MRRIRGAFAKVSTWIVTGVVVLVELAGMALAFGLARPDVGVLLFQAIPTPVLVGITYTYARSTADMVSFLKVQATEQKKMAFEDILAELVEALRTKRPLFNVSRWQIYKGRLAHSPILSKDEVGAITLAYDRLMAANEGVESARNLPDGFANMFFRGFQPFSRDDEEVIQKAVDVLRRVLDEWEQRAKQEVSK